MNPQPFMCVELRLEAKFSAVVPTVLCCVPSSRGRTVDSSLLGAKFSCHGEGGAYYLSWVFMFFSS
jgi:hypothetical protein